MEANAEHRTPNIERPMPEDWSALDRFVHGDPVRHNESLTSAAIDGARIATLIALNLVDLDQEIDPERKAELMIAIADAGAALDHARKRFPVIATSVHIVGGGS